MASSAAADGSLRCRVLTMGKALPGSGAGEHGKSLCLLLSFAVNLILP